MRDLTEEELSLAPDWATHYTIDTMEDVVIYESRELFWWVGLSKKVHNFSFDSERNRPIRKPFDINKHEFSDGISISNMCQSKVEIEFKGNDDFNYIPLNKDDVIAIAKALGVTGEDLK